MKRLMSRIQAAQMLREARRARVTDSERSAELVGWIFSAMRDNPRVVRLKIDVLLDAQVYDSADALLARRLMQHDDHPLLRLRLARSLHEQGRVAAAEVELQKVLERRPKSCAALVLASRLAEARGDTAGALSLLNMAADERPGNRDLQYQFIQSLLDAGLVEQASDRLERMEDPPATYRARVLRRQGRVLEAIELLESAVRSGDDKGGETLGELIECLEGAGDRRRLLEWMPRLHASQPAVLLRAAQSLLSIGEVPSAIDAFRSVCSNLAPPALKRKARAALSVIRALESAAATDDIFAAANGDQTTLASFTAGLWLRGFLGRLGSGRCGENLTGADPALRVLGPLLADAVRVLEGAAQDSRERTPAQQAPIERSLAICRRAIDQVQMPQPRSATAAAAGDQSSHFIESPQVQRKAA